MFIGNACAERVCLQVKLATGSGVAASSDKRRQSVGKDKLVVEYLEGHCAIGLERLCKIAASNLQSTQSRDSSVLAKTSVTQILLHEGVPLYHIDPTTLQVRHHHLCLRSSVMIC